MEPRQDRRDLYNGFGETMSRAFELALAPVIFAGLGYLIDRWLGTRPVFLVLLVAFAVVAMFLRSWYAYAAEMRTHEESAPWRKT